MALPEVIVLDLIKETDEPRVETKILDGLARVTFLEASNEKDLTEARVRDAVAVIAYHTCHLGPAQLALMPKLRLISRAGVGFDNCDLVACTARRVAVCTVPDYGTEEVADSTWALLLSLSRQTFVLAKAVEAGTWPQLDAMHGFRLRGKHLGLVGFGRIARAVAVRALAFGLRVAFYDPYVADGYDKSMGVGRFDSLHELMADSDVVSVHCLLNAETRHLLNHDAFSHSKRGQYVINTARGPIIQEEALVAALRDGRVAGVGLDVLEHEPTRRDQSAHESSQLFQFNNVIVTPHAAFLSAESWIELRSKAAINCANLLAGKPLRNVQNPQALDAQ